MARIDINGSSFDIVPILIQRNEASDKVKRSLSDEAHLDFQQIQYHQVNRVDGSRLNYRLDTDSVVDSKSRC